MKTLYLVRQISERTNDNIVSTKVKELLIKVLQGVNNWTASFSKPEVTNNANLYTFRVKCTFKRSSGQDHTFEKQWHKLVERTIRAGSRACYGKYPWKVECSEIQSGLVADNASKGFTNNDLDLKDLKDLSDISMDRKDYFNHIYGRDPQIEIICSAIHAGIESDWNNRFHCVLYGPPGCGKSDILISVGKMLGIENESYIKLDATSTTEAGAQKLLLESSYIPPVLIVEEIEKTDEKSLRWLLGILDHRAEIRKSNYRIGHNAKNVKMLCLATVNDLVLFKKVMSGALASRFSHEIYCPRPSREILGKILEREVSRINGNLAWIEPTLKYCDEKQLNDPRKVVPICICGKDKLLTGEYQKWLNSISYNE